MGALDWDQVLQIRARIGTVSGCALAREYGVSQQTVWAIVNGKTWRKSPEERATQKAEVRRQRLLRRRAQTYGITVEEVVSLGDACHICGALSSGRWGTLHVDHDHKSGEVRGLLCVGCNQGIGAFADDPRRLEAAAQYLLHGGKRL